MLAEKKVIGFMLAKKKKGRLKKNNSKNRQGPGTDGVSCELFLVQETAGVGVQEHP